MKYFIPTQCPPICAQFFTLKNLKTSQTSPYLAVGYLCFRQCAVFQDRRIRRCTLFAGDRSAEMAIAPGNPFLMQWGPGKCLQLVRKRLGRNDYCSQR